VQLSAEQAACCIDEVGIGFLSAPACHPAMKHALPPRQEIGLRTIFNLLGPLCNPAGAKRQLVGVYDPDLTATLAEVLLALGSEHAFVVHGADGLDELSVTGPNRVSHLRDGQVKTFSIDPRDLGLPQAMLGELSGGSAEENAAITRALLEGEKGPKRDVILLNAAAALVAGGKAESLGDGLELAAEAVDSGAALSKLNELVEFSCSLQ